VGHAILQSSNVRSVVRGRQQQKGPIGATQGTREKRKIGQITREQLCTLGGKALGLFDVADNGADAMAQSQQLASNYGTNVTSGTCDDEDGHGYSSDGLGGFGNRGVGLDVRFAREVSFNLRVGEPVAWCGRDRF
jgi:hypothetical protein